LDLNQDNYSFIEILPIKRLYQMLMLLLWFNTQLNFFKLKTLLYVDIMDAEESKLLLKSKIMVL